MCVFVYIYMCVSAVKVYAVMQGIQTYKGVMVIGRGNEHSGLSSNPG